MWCWGGGLLPLVGGMGLFPCNLQLFMPLCLQHVFGQDASGVAGTDEISCEMDRCGALAKFLQMYILSSCFYLAYVYIIDQCN